MSPLLFDVCVIVLILLSAGLGFMRGFCNEIFTIFGWIGAVLATILLTPASRPFMRTYIDSKILADLATASCIFVITMVVFTIISHYATKSLQHSKLNAVDRSLGFGFGILRGVILLGLAFLLVALLWAPEDRPEMIRKARTRPLLEVTANWVQDILPGESTIEVTKTDDTDSELDKIMRGETDADDSDTKSDDTETSAPQDNKQQDDSK
jgi:membrane protein required for colicin V production